MSFLRNILISLCFSLISSSNIYADSFLLPDHAILGPKDQAAVSSKTIVLIHGMYLTPESWAQWKQYFEEKGYTVYAPAWPLHDESVETLQNKHPNSALGQLELKDVLAHYRNFLSKLDEKPILIGHSMGGLLVQLLLQENLGEAGIAIDSAPPFGVLPVESDFFRSNWPFLSPFVNAAEPLKLTEEQFFFGFAQGCLSQEESLPFYQEHAVPESRKVGRGPTSLTAGINFLKKSQPLLFIAGREDKTIPAALNFRNFQKYALSNSLTEFKAFPNRCHLITLQDSWQEVADYIDSWLLRIGG